MEEEKIQISVYQIALDSDLFQDENKLDTLTQTIESKGYTQQEISDGIDGFSLKLLYGVKPQNPKWKKFLSQVTTDNQPISEINKSWTESFILLAQNKNNIYAVTGGLGFFIIQDYINQDFGIDVISRLIKKEDKIIKATKEKSVVGGVIGSSKNFRKNYNLFENDSFGKIYQELKANLDKEILQSKFGFNHDDLKKDSFCIAKTSFRINKSITFEQLFEIIKGCEYLIDNVDAIAINNVEKIVKKKNQTLINNLENELFSQLWNRYQQPEDYNIDFDLCHKEFEKYLTASKYIVKKNLSNKNFFDDFVFEELDNVDLLFSKIKELEDSPDNEQGFRELISSLKIYSYDENDEELTHGWLHHHIHGDVEIDEKRYFFIDKSWYLIKEEFIKELNEGCKHFISEHTNEELTNKWNYPTQKENDYNQTYFEQENTLVIDKVTPENIEPCDILKWDDETLFFYHVKAGFGNTMRDLCSQIIIAANRINGSKLGDKKYLKKIYKQMKDKSSSSDEYYKKVAKQTDSLTEDQFLALFDKHLIFVLAVLDTGTNERSLSEIEKFKSNIAKFSLQELYKEMRSIDVALEIIQIKKGN
ncbi:TIGR04141 family sporadically distributed protein [Patescibacteria group bacterium]|nr:TIGR04141 family sporadically distributed protein [Patescibacteria group bacterium]MBU1758074.1 TIGR04141 family sporadically distributed protein [Patescibacteria group bacterium]